MGGLIAIYEQQQQNNYNSKYANCYSLKANFNIDMLTTRDNVFI